MKKSLVFAFATLMAVAVFTSCEDPELTIADLQGYTFVGSDSDGAEYALSFPTGETFGFTITFLGSPMIYAGTFSIEGTNVRLLYNGGAVETLGSDGKKKLLYETVVGVDTPETVVLVRQ